MSVMHDGNLVMYVPRKEQGVRGVFSIVHI